MKLNKTSVKNEAKKKKEFIFPSGKNEKISSIPSRETWDKVLSHFPTCSKELKQFIEETSLEDLVYWKIQSLFEKFETDVPKHVLRTVIAHVERPLYALVLKKTGGNQSKAAELLGCNRNTLHKRLRDFYSLEPREVSLFFKSKSNNGN